MNFQNQNKQSDSSLYHNYLQKDQIQQNKRKKQYKPKFSFDRESYHNPFQKKTIKNLQQSQCRPFGQRLQKVQMEHQIKNQFTSFQNKHSASNKFMIQSSQSFVFKRKSINQNQKQSFQFQFNNNQSGSLFNSQKSQKEVVQTLKLNKNLQAYTKLLRQYYNQSYLQNNNSKIKNYSHASRFSSIRKSQIPYFITRQPIIFQKKFEGVRSSHGLSGNFLCKLIQNKIYYKNITNQQLLSNGIDNAVKCQYIELPQNQQSISPSLQIDANNLHLFYFSNTYNQVVVMSLSKSRRNNPQICRIKARVKRQNPLLYLIAVNSKVLLLLIGGFNQISKKKSQQVQGCKFIQIFSVDTWGKDIIRSKVIKMITGKIYPLIIFPVKIQQNDSILLIGGNTMAKRSKNSQLKLDFKQYKVINNSSNYRGVFINTKQLIQCLQQNKQIMSLPTANNISVQLQDKLSHLYCGFVDYLKSSNQKQKIRLFLPKIRYFYRMKIIKKEVIIIKQNLQKYLSFESKQRYTHLEMKCFKKPSIQYFQINNKGYIQKKNIQLSDLNVQNVHVSLCEQNEKLNIITYLGSFIKNTSKNKMISQLLKGLYQNFTGQHVGNDAYTCLQKHIFSGIIKNKFKIVVLIIQNVYIFNVIILLKFFINLNEINNSIMYFTKKQGKVSMSKDFHHMNALRKVLASNNKINNLLCLIRSVLQKYKNRSQEQFVNSIELKFLCKQMEKIHINEIEQLLDGINNPQTIIALPLSIEKYFTLFFVIVPQDQQFNWHDHPKMTGFTKCVHGKLKITAMDKNKLQQKDDLYYFPTESLRIQTLQSRSDINLSAIYPDQFNVHKIEALQLSAFFDLLMPDYPDDMCSFFNTLEQKQGKLILQKLQNSSQQIKGFDVVLKQLSQVKKIQNIILK